MIWFVPTVALLSGCRDPVGPAGPPDVTRWVVGEAAEHLDRNGRFVFPPAHVVTPHPTIDEARARELALAYVRTFSSLSDFWQPLEAQHQGPIDASRLEVVSRVEFADTPYSVLPDTFPGWLIRTLSPIFLVRLTSRSVPVIVVSVSLHATEIAIRDRRVVFPSQSGGEFHVSGMSSHPGYSSPVGPERATEFVAVTTGAKIRALPLLVRPDRRYSMTFARWRLLLDREIEFTDVSTGTPRRSSEVYVGMEPLTGVPGGNPTALFLPTTSQPAMDSIRSDATWYFSVRPDIPTAFDRVQITQPVSIDY